MKSAKPIFAVLAMTLGAFLLTARGEPLPYPILKQGGTVLFHGDSITDGGWLRNSGDLNHIMGQSYPYLVSARLGLELAERNLTFVNRGVGGSGITAISTYEALKLKPCLVSIATGINDCVMPDTSPGRGLPPERFEEVYAALIEKFCAELPAAQLVLVVPFTLGKEGSERDVQRRTSLKPYQEAVERLGRKYNLPFVLLQPAFDAALAIAPARHWCWDGIHPTYAGHAIIEREWLKTVAAISASATGQP